MRYVGMVAMRIFAWEGVVKINKISWKLPLPRPHCGVVLGNGCFGALVWGGGSRLNLTVNRADYWDRRGGELIAEGVSYAKLCAAYDPEHPEKLTPLFRPQPADRPADWFRSTRLPGGRFEMELGPETVLEQAVLAYRQGELTVECRQGKRISRLRLLLSPERDLLTVDDPEKLIKSVRARPGWEWVAAELQAGGYAAPELLDTADECGWVQSCPADPALAAVMRKNGTGWTCSLKLGADAAAALSAARAVCANFTSQSLVELRREAREWWRHYWQAAPQVRLPAGFYNTFLNYALYKFACATSPAGGVPAGLQGPWIEEYQTARWGGDYHFNVNIQQIYTVAFAANHPEHLLPLFDMLESAPFQAVMRRHARILVGIDDGLALTHTTNDRGAAVGGVGGPGCVLDHAALGWLAQLYWLYYLYTGDAEFLRARAWPFLRGVMRTYEAMLTEKDGRLHLPLGISAEYRNHQGHTCGPNPSYQLACIHMLAQALLAAADVLQEPPAPVWREIEQKLPPYTLVGAPGEERIAIWDGQDLDICHRHHSHLACIYPFDSLGAAAWDDPAVRAIVDNSLDHWILKGMGQWSEWCIPWAAIIQARLGLNEAPLTMLETWRRVFVNEGLATAYLPKFRGISAHRRADIAQPREKNEIMQLDGTMAAATALYEFLAHTHAGLTRIFAGVPAEWRNVSFKNIRLPGLFLASAVRKDGVTTQVKLCAPRGGVIRVAVAGQARMRLDGRQRPASAVDLPATINLRPRETVWLRAM